MAHHKRALLVATGIVLTGCTAAGSTGPAPTRAVTTAGQSAVESQPPAESAVEQPSAQPWTLDLPVIGQPVSVDGVAVVHTAAEDALAIVAVNVATGEQLWSRPASPGFVVPGISIQPTVVEDEEGTEYVAYLRPERETSLNARLVVADPRTGEDIAATELTSFSSPPSSCDDGVDVCLDLDETAAFDGGPYRLRLSDGDFSREPTAGGYVRPVGPLGLSDLREYDVASRSYHQYLARIDNGEELWRIHVEDAFGPGSSTDGGWGWTHTEDAGLLIGWIGRAHEGLFTDPQDIDLSAYSTVALDVATGGVVWREPGTGPLCRSALTLPGGDKHDDYAVRCRYQGEMTVATNQDPAFRGLDVVLEGYDSRTGRTSWQLPMGAAEGLAWDGGVGDVTGPVELVMPTPDGPVAIDLRTGDQRFPAADEVIACLTPVVSFEYDDAYFILQEPITERHGGTLIQWCRPDRTPTDRPPPATLLAATAVQIGAHYVVATPTGLAGYPSG